MNRWGTFRLGANPDDPGAFADAGGYASPGGFAPRWFRDVPETQDDLLSLPYWERPLGGTIGGRGKGKPGGVGDNAPEDNDTSATIRLPQVVGGTPEDLAVDVDRTVSYTIEIFRSFSFVAKVTEWTAGRLRMEIDKPSELQFSVAGNSSLAASLEPPNVIHLKDRWGFVMGVFHIKRRVKRRDGDAYFVDVFAQDGLVQMAREPIATYNTGYDEQQTMAMAGVTDPLGNNDGWVRIPKKKRVADIIGDLLSEQVQSPAIGFGKISRSIADFEVAFSVDVTTLLDAVQKLQAALPKQLAGHQYYDAKNRFNWTSSVGTRGESIELGKGLQGITHEADWDEVITRLYLYGEGSDHRTRVKLTDRGADSAYEYVTASTSGAYGVLPRIKVLNNVKHPATLLNIANRTIEEFKDPQLSLTINAIDLSRTDTAGFESINDFYVGSEYRVIDSDQSLDLTVRVQSIEHDLENPLPVTIQLDNRRKSFSDYIKFIIDQMNPPVDVNDDGTRYPNIKRTFYGDETDSTSANYIPGLVYRDGDQRTEALGVSVRRKQRWVQQGIYYNGLAKSSLPDDENIEKYAMARTDDARLYKRNEDNDGWTSADSFPEGTQNAGLFKITGEDSGAWQIKRIDLDGAEYGDTFSGVKVGHSMLNAYAVDDIVFAVPIRNGIDSEESTFGIMNLATDDGIFKITAGTAGDWTIQRLGNDGATYGPEYESVTVVSGHGDPFEINDTVLARSVPTLGGSQSAAVSWKIWNGLTVEA